AVLAELRVDPRKVERAPSDNREGVWERVALSAGGQPIAMRIAEQVEIVAAVDAKQRFEPAVRGCFGPSDRCEDRVDTPQVLGGGMKLAVEEFRRRRVGALALVPEASHRCGLAAAADVGRPQPLIADVFGLPLRLVDAIFLSSFSLIDSYMLFEAPLSELFGFSCSLTARAAPAASCWAFDLAGMIASPFQDMRIKRLAAAIASLKT